MPKRMFVVSYDLPAATTAETRKAITDAVQASGDWWHHMRPTWLVVSDGNANDVAGSITPLVREAKGRLLVMEVAPANRQGLLPKEGWNWIRKWSASLRSPK